MGLWNGSQAQKSSVCIACLQCLLLFLALMMDHVPGGTTEEHSYVVVFQPRPKFPSTAYEKLLYIVSDTSVDVNVTYTANSVTSQVSKHVNSTSPVSVQIPVELEEVSYSPHAAIHVQASGWVSVFALKLHEEYGDGFLVLPTHALGSSYVAMTYTSGKPRAQVAVAAVDDVTWVTLTQGESTLANVSLDRFDVYHLHSSKDFSGVVVTASKPVAVFSGNSRAQPPFFGTYDHLATQLLPLRLWGTRFVTPPTLNYDQTTRDLVRVFSREVNTTVKVSGQPDLVLSGLGDWAEMEVKVNDATVISADKPVQVMKMVSVQDPLYEVCMSVVLPLSLWRSSYLFVTSTLMTSTDIWVIKQVETTLVGTVWFGDCLEEVLPCWGGLYHACVAVAPPDTKVNLTSNDGKTFAAYALSHRVDAAACHPLGINLADAGVGNETNTECFTSSTSQHQLEIVTSDYSVQYSTVSATSAFPVQYPAVGATSPQSQQYPTASATSDYPVLYSAVGTTSDHPVLYSAVGTTSDYSVQYSTVGTTSDYPVQYSTVGTTSDYSVQYSTVGTTSDYSVLYSFVGTTSDYPVQYSTVGTTSDYPVQYSTVGTTSDYSMQYSTVGTTSDYSMQYSTVGTTSDHSMQYSSVSAMSNYSVQYSTVSATSDHSMEYPNVDATTTFPMQHSTAGATGHHPQQYLTAGATSDHPIQYPTVSATIDYPKQYPTVSRTSDYSGQYPTVSTTSDYQKQYPTVSRTSDYSGQYPTVGCCGSSEWTSSPSTPVLPSTSPYDTSVNPSPTSSHATPRCSCRLRCSKGGKYTAGGLSQEVSRLQQELTVEAAKTSATRRKLTSAQDRRGSSQSIGTAAVAVVMVLLAGFVLSDLPKLTRDLRSTLRRLRSNEYNDDP